jgi:cytochrome c5
MREQWAKRIAILIGMLVFLLAITFAHIQNPLETSDSITNRDQPLPTELLEPVVLDVERIKAGRLIYEQQTCSRCHSIAGHGNPRNSLDGVGTRRTALELRDWIIGADVLKGELPEYAFKLKQVYSELPGDDIDALVIYMQSLRQ